jgi:tetratricopeptide (TPR) repeat protein
LELQDRPASGAQRGDTHTHLAVYSRFVAARGYLRAYDRADNLQRAISELEAITAADPSYAPAQVALSEALFRQYSATRQSEWLARADQAVRSAAELDANEPGVHLMRARILRATGEFAAAIGELEQSLARDPADVAALLQLAGAYEGAKRPADAEATYRRAIRLRPSYFPAYNNLGVLYMSQGKWQQAEEPLTIVTKLAPEYADGWTSLGSLKYYLDRVDDAYQLFSKSIELKPTAGAYANRCGVEFDRGNLEAAAGDCRRAVDLQPASPIAWGNLADVLAANHRAAEAGEAYRKGLETGDRQIAVNPVNPDLLATMAKFAAKTDQKKLARDLAAKALSQGSGVRVLYNAGKAYGLAGDCSRAAGLLKKALEAGYPRAEARRDPDLNRLRAAPLTCAIPPV